MHFFMNIIYIYIYIYIYLFGDLMKRESTKVWITQKIRKEMENSYQKMKRFLDKRNTQAHQILTEIFRQSHMSFSIKRE